MCRKVLLFDVEMTQTPIPEKELELFKQLPNLKVIFDVGARTDTDYLEICPNAEFHLFEPNPVFFEELVKKVMNRGNVAVNRVGLGHRNGMFMYCDPLQAFEGGAQNLAGYMALPIMTLDGYAKKCNITSIDFLKIDTEGYDLNVLKGGKETIKCTRFIQYEHWNNDEDFHKLLGRQFHIEYVGYRNSLCINKRLVSKGEKNTILKFIRDNDMASLA